MSFSALAIHDNTPPRIEIVNPTTGFAFAIFPIGVCISLIACAAAVHRINSRGIIHDVFFVAIVRIPTGVYRSALLPRSGETDA